MTYKIAIFDRIKIPWPWNTALLVALLALVQIPFYIDITDPSSVFMHGDHPKFFELALRQVELMRNHFVLYGFEHAFQGGIPTVTHLRGTGIVFFPFALLFGPQLGHLLMVCAAIVATPVAFLFAVHTHVRDRIISATAAVICAFQVGIWPPLGFGNTAFTVAIPLFLTAIGLFTRYIAGRTRDLFLLAPIAALTLYTHMGVAVHLFLFVVGRAAWDVMRSQTPKETLRVIVTKLAISGSLVALLIAPLLFGYIAHRGLVSIQHGYVEPLRFSVFLKRLIDDHVTLENSLLISMMLLFIHWISSSRKRSLISTALCAGLVVFSFHVFAGISPRAENLSKRAEIYESFLSVVNFAIIAQIPNSRWIKVALASLFCILIFKFNDFLFFGPLSAGSPKNIDNKLIEIVQDDDYVLIEHCTHLRTGRIGTRSLRGCNYQHKMMMMQRDLDVRLFAHVGDCPHPGNRLRSMYLAAGYFDGIPITDLDSHEVDNHLKQWGVSLMCVVTETANMFFGQDISRYKRVGDSEYYTCYRPAYRVDPEVELLSGGTGEVIEQTPFSLVLRLSPTSGSSSFRLRRNYSSVWKAVNEEGEPLALEECGGMICGKIKGSTEVILHFPKYHLAHICAALTFTVLLALWFWKSIIAYRRPKEEANPKTD